MRARESIPFRFLSIAALVGVDLLSFFNVRCASRSNAPSLCRSLDGHNPFGYPSWASLSGFAKVALGRDLFAGFCDSMSGLLKTLRLR